MVRSMTAAVSGLRAHQTKLDVIGNNIANVNTAAYKSTRVVFRDAMYQTLSGSSNASALYAGTNANQVGYGSSVASISTIWTPGAYNPTDFGTDVMIDGSGYFLVGPAPDPNGSGSYPVGDVSNLYLTRVGEFFVIDGYLVDSVGNYVYGFMPKDAAPPANADANHWEVDNPDYEDTQLTRIKVPLLDPNDPDKGYINLEGIQIGTDGTLSGITDVDANRDPQENTPVVIGKIAIANVPNENGLESIGNSYYSVGLNAGNVTAYTPGEGTTGKLRAGGLEMSTVDLSKEFTEMITTQRGFQANSRIITVTDEMLQELVNLKR